MVYKGLERRGSTARVGEGGADTAESAEELGLICARHKRGVEREKMYLTVGEKIV